MDRAFLAIYRNDGATAHFQIDHLSPQSLRAQLAPILFKVGVPFLDDPFFTGPNAAPQEPVAPASVADELAKLAELRDQGILSEDEFLAQKGRLLS